MSYFLDVTPFHNTIISWYIYIYNDIMIFYFLILYILVFVSFAAFIHVFIFLVYDQDIFAYDTVFFCESCYDQHFFAFCSRIVNIIAEIFIPTRIFVYKSWTIYKIQNIQNTKFFADYKIQNTKFIFYIDNFFFLEHFKCPLFKGISFIFVRKWLIQQIKQQKNPSNFIRTW